MSERNTTKNNGSTQRKTIGWRSAAAALCAIAALGSTPAEAQRWDRVLISNTAQTTSTIEEPRVGLDSAGCAGGKRESSRPDRPGTRA